MELRGYRRANKPQSGLFSRHYYTTSCPLFNLDGAVRKRSVPAARSSQLVEKVFSTSFLRFQNFQKVLKSIDLNGAGHPSWVHLRAKSRATPGCAPKRPAGQPRTPFLPVFLRFRVYRQSGHTILYNARANFHLSFLLKIGASPLIYPAPTPPGSGRCPSPRSRYRRF